MGSVYCRVPHPSPAWVGKHDPHSGIRDAIYKSGTVTISSLAVAENYRPRPHNRYGEWEMPNLVFHETCHSFRRGLRQNRKCGKQFGFVNYRLEALKSSSGPFLFLALLRYRPYFQPLADDKTEDNGYPSPLWPCDPSRSSPRLSSKRLIDKELMLNAGFLFHGSAFRQMFADFIPGTARPGEALIQEKLPCGESGKRLHFSDAPLQRS